MTKRKKKKRQKELFSIGYGELRERVGYGSIFTMSCFCCDYFYKVDGDKEEVCQNPDVLQYDMVVNEHSIYCNQWRLSRRSISMKELYNKRSTNK